jgi:hypothetical protein
MKRLLLYYFSRGVTWFTLFNIVLGTNYLFYITRAPGMSHIYSFTLVAAILLVVRRYYLSPTAGKAMLLGFLLGWLVLIRPTNVVFPVFILLFGVATKADLLERWRFIWTRKADILWMLPLFILPILPQLFYWHEILGKWVSYSYANEHFIYWNNPKILAVLFDTQNGLFIYAPVLLFVFPALWLYRKDARVHFAGFAVVFSIITYIFASWWAWWFGGAYGHRCYIEYFPIFAFPLAVAFEKIGQMKQPLLRFSLIALVLGMAYYSVGLDLIYEKNGPAWDGPEWRWNFHMLWRMVKQII